MAIGMNNLNKNDSSIAFFALPNGRTAKDISNMKKIKKEYTKVPISILHKKANS